MKSINKIIIFSLNLLISLGILCAVYFLVYDGINKSHKKQNTVYDDYSVIDDKLSDFSKVKGDMNEKKEAILDMIYNYQEFMYSNSQNVNTYKMKVIRILNKLGISVKNDKDKNASSGNAIIRHKSGSSSMTINMVTSYENLCKFLFELEKFSTVSSVDADFKGEIEIKCSPIAFSSEVDDYFNDKKPARKGKKDSLDSVKYFEDIFDKTQKLKESIGVIPVWKDFKPVPKTPFYKYVPPKKVVVSKVTVDYTKPDINIDGIMYEKDDPIVIIGGKFYHVGDRVQNARITKIDHNTLYINHYGRIYSYKMKY